MLETSMFRKVFTRAHVAVASAAVLATLPGSRAAQQSLTVTSWGGAYTMSQVESMHKPFSQGLDKDQRRCAGLQTAISPSPAPGRSRQRQVGRWWTLEPAEAMKGCEEGLLEKSTPASCRPGADGTACCKDFGAGLVTDPALSANIAYANVVAYDKAKLGATRPRPWNDFFDLARLPGKRGMRSKPSVNLEWALIADGVPVADVCEGAGQPGRRGPRVQEARHHQEQHRRGGDAGASPRSCWPLAKS
jgi:putative spermidine/putrescine transport system substrate-binding protein